MKPFALVSPLEGAQPLSYTITSACNATGIGRSRLYEKIKSGEIPLRKLGKRSLILKKDLERFLESLPTVAATKPKPVNAKAELAVKRRHSTKAARST
jgi:excisionase family DNA binding protein